ncbi:hypothetical protein Dimus_008241 [Dionaea muscipula]
MGRKKRVTRLPGGSGTGGECGGGSGMGDGSDGGCSGSVGGGSGGPLASGELSSGLAKLCSNSNDGGVGSGLVGFSSGLALSGGREVLGSGSATLAPRDE